MPFSLRRANNRAVDAGWSAIAGGDSISKLDVPEVAFLIRCRILP
jgi:hypothetical protein